MSQTKLTLNQEESVGDANESRPKVAPIKVGTLVVELFENLPPKVTFEGTIVARHILLLQKKLHRLYNEWKATLRKKERK